MNRAGAPMHRLHAFGHTTPCTACSNAAVPPAAARGPSSRVSAFRDSPISYSCSVDTAHAAVTTRSAAKLSGDGAPPELAAPWQPLSPSISLTDTAASTSRAQHRTSDGPSHLSDSSRQRVLQAPQQQTALQHSIVQHSQPAAAASAARQSSSAQAWHAQHTAAVSCWRLLVDPGQDETSAIILSCSSTQQLLGVAQELLRKPVSKWHNARLAAMAAVLTATTGTQLQPMAAGLQEASAHHQAPPMPAQQQLPGQKLVQQQQQQETQVQQPELQSAGATSQHLLQDHQQQQQQQHQEAHAAYALTCRVLEAVVSPCIDTGLPTLHALRGVYLAETLHAVQQLLQRSPQGNPQPQQQQLQQHMASMQEPALLSAIHACGSAEQLRSVVSLASAHFSPLHLKAVFVQFARLLSPTGSSAGTATTSRSSSSSSSSGGGGCAALLQHLLQLLALQLPALQSHQCASILWSLGQLQHLGSMPNPSTTRHSNSSSGIDLLSMQQQLLQGALAGLQRLNPRVCAQLLHGAAKLQLQVPEAEVQVLLQHTQQQLQQCDPQALACMLWSFAKLQRPEDQVPDKAWLEAFYSSSWRRLQSADPSSSSSDSSSLSDSSSDSDSSNRGLQQDQAPAWRRKDVCSGFEPPELSALLTAACSWQLQPPGGWLAAVADSASRQMSSFQHQELGLLLWSFARLQYIPPRALVEAAGMRSLELGAGSFSPQTLSLLLYGATRLQRWQWQAQQPVSDQQGQQVNCPASDAVAAEQLRWSQWNAVDLAILAWSLGMQQLLLDKQRKPRRQQQQRATSSTTQQQEQQQEQHHGLLPPALLHAATAKLQQHQFSRQGISMLIWGLGTALQHGSLSSSSSTVAQAQQYAGLLAALLEAAAAAVEPHAADLSPHELCSVVSGLGALSKAWQAAMQASTAAATATACSRTNSSGSSSSSGSGRPAAAAECLDLLSCQLLYACDQLSNYQLAAAVQGLCWAQHPRGLDVLHAALLPQGTVSRLQLAQPQELLLYLRACVAYKYVPMGAAWGAVVAALQRVCPQLESADAAQLLYLLGKLQMLSYRRQRQRAVQAAAAAAATAAMWAATQQQRRKQERVQQQRQREQHVVLKPLLPEPLLGKLLAQTQGCVQQCSSRDVSLMLWGVSHLQRHQSCPPQQQDQGTAGSSEAAGSTAASNVDKQTDQLVASIYPYTLQQLHSFAPGNLATLLYALQRLRARPEDSWLYTVATRFTAQQLSSMDGQSLAVLALALAGLSWVAPKAWVDAYVQVVAAVDRRGGLVTTWQKRCINNGLAALNPLAVQSWLQ